MSICAQTHPALANTVGGWGTYETDYQPYQYPTTSEPFRHQIDPTPAHIWNPWPWQPYVPPATTETVSNIVIGSPVQPSPTKVAEIVTEVITAMVKGGAKLDEAVKIAKKVAAAME